MINVGIRTLIVLTALLASALLGGPVLADEATPLLGETPPLDARLSLTTPSPFAMAEDEGAGVAAAPLADVEPAQASDWRGSFTAWIWLMGVEGDVGARSLTVDVDANFGDVLDASDSLFALSGRLEVGKGRIAGFIDGIYADIGADGRSGPLGFGDIDVTMELGVVDFGLMYRLIDTPVGDHAPQQNFVLDVYVGGRYVTGEVKLDPALAATRKRNRDWIDPIVGAKVRVPLNQSIHVDVWGDIGGFGAASDLTWSATGVIGFDFDLCELPMTVFAGYRAIAHDYSKGSGADRFVWDVVLHGPILGFSIRF